MLGMEHAIRKKRNEEKRRVIKSNEKKLFDSGMLPSSPLWIMQAIL